MYVQEKNEISLFVENCVTLTAVCSKNVYVVV